MVTKQYKYDAFYTKNRAMHVISRPIMHSAHGKLPKYCIVQTSILSHYIQLYIVNIVQTGSCINLDRCT